MSEAENRRQFPRHACSVMMEGMRPAQADASRRGFACRAINASEGGLLIESEAPLAVGQRITLNLHGTDRSRAVDAEAEVVWTKLEGRVHRSGVRYLRRREEFVV